MLLPMWLQFLMATGPLTSAPPHELLIFLTPQLSERTKSFRRLVPATVIFAFFFFPRISFLTPSFFRTRFSAAPVSPGFWPLAAKADWVLSGFTRTESHGVSFCPLVIQPFEFPWVSFPSLCILGSAPAPPFPCFISGPLLPQRSLVLRVQYAIRSFLAQLSPLLGAPANFWVLAKSS